MIMTSAQIKKVFSQMKKEKLQLNASVKYVWEITVQYKEKQKEQK